MAHYDALYDAARLRLAIVRFLDVSDDHNFDNHPLVLGLAYNHIDGFNNNFIGLT